MSMCVFCVCSGSSALDHSSVKDVASASTHCSVMAASKDGGAGAQIKVALNGEGGRGEKGAGMNTHLA